MSNKDSLGLNRIARRKSFGLVSDADKKKTIRTHKERIRQMIDERSLSQGVQVLRVGLCGLIVCSPLGVKETLAIVQAEFPAGTENNWAYDTRQRLDTDTPSTMQCESYPERKHYRFIC
jgi:hypothetical protein